MKMFEKKSWLCIEKPNFINQKKELFTRMMTVMEFHIVTGEHS